MAQSSTAPSWRGPLTGESSTQNPRSRRKARIGAVALAALGTLIVTAFAFAPRIVRTQIERAVHHRCPGCTVSMGTVNVPWTLNTVRISDLRIGSDRARPGAIALRVAYMDVRTTRGALLSAALHRRAPRIDAVSVRGLAVTDAPPNHLQRMELAIGSVDAGPAAGWIRLDTIRFTGDATRNVHLQGTVGSLLVAFEPRTTRAGVIRVDSVSLDRALVTLTQNHEGEQWLDPPPPAVRPPPWWQGLPVARLGAVELHRSTFVYADRNRGATASVAFSELEAHLSALATRPGLAPQRLDFVATGLSAGSGRARLGVHLTPLDGDDDTTIELALHGQDLAGFESYTVPAEGMHLHGAIDEAFAVMHIQGADHVRGALSGTYRGLDLLFTRSRAHGRIESAVLNLGISLEIATSDADRPPAGRMALIDVARRPREPLMGYLWRCVSSTAVHIAHKV